jgi:hypothetical protein
MAGRLVSRAEANRRWHTDNIEQGSRAARGLDAENSPRKEQAQKVIQRRADPGRSDAQRSW